MNDHTPTPQTDVTSLLAAVDTVKQLIAAGMLDPAQLGLRAGHVPDSVVAAYTRPDQAHDDQQVPDRHLVPGTPITVRDLVAKASRGLKHSTRRTYGSYMKLLADGHIDPLDESLTHFGLGDKFAHEVLPSELEELLAFVRRRALVHAERRAAIRRGVGRVARESDGVGACYNAVGAWRRVFAVAVKDRHLARQFDPAQEIKKPKRCTGNRRPLKHQQVNEFWSVVRGTGNDPELDWMICQTILISGARREGLLNLTLGWVDRESCTIRLDEKFDKKVDQPVPDWFVHLLHDFAVSRGATHPTDKVFRLRAAADGTPGEPITSRRLDGLFQRVQSLLPWADRDQLTAHTLRHHAIALVERHAGNQVSAAFARHEPEDTHSLYGRASREEVAQAVIEIHGGEHPLVNDPSAQD